MTLPPRPPLPPSGPPSGLNFSRWIEAQPLPPEPARTWMTTRSTNRGIGGHSLERNARAENGLPAAALHSRGSAGRGAGRDDADGLASALDAELHCPGR